MKGLIVALLIFIAAGVGFLAYSELREQKELAELEATAQGLAEAQKAAAEERLKTQIADGIRFAAPPRAAFTEFYNDFGKFPESWNEAGVSILAIGLPDYIVDIALGKSGAIGVFYNMHVMEFPPDVSAAYLELVPSASQSGRLEWSCFVSTGLGKHPELLPEDCRT